MTKRILTYGLLIAALVLIAAGCGSGNTKKLNERISFWRKDKIPYGNFVAFENLKSIFPEAEIKINSKSPDPYHEIGWNNITAAFKPDSPVYYKKKVHLIIGRNIFADKREVDALLEKVSSGDNIFISCMNYSQEIIDSFRFNPAYWFSLKNDSLTVNVQQPVSGDSVSFTYPGSSYSSYLLGYDTLYNTVLGRSENGHPNFIKVHYLSGGNIYFHFAPIAFSNFFLLHKNNIDYYNDVLSYLPHDADVVYWDDYFRNKDYKDFSPLAVILKNDSLRWAFWMVIAIFLFLLLFQSKRRQRLIPLKKPVKNTTLDFVRTVGRLYYQRRDNKNLAQKMAAHFLDHVRTKYHMPTTLLDDQFTRKLAFKSGYDTEALKQVIYSVSTLSDYPALTDEELITFSKNLESFYKHS